MEFGPNAWMVDDMFSRYLADPESVSKSWREFFKDRDGARTLSLSVTASTPALSQTPSSDEDLASIPAPTEERIPLRGASARLASNMESSLSIPVATSIRTIPTKLLEVNRKLMNDYLLRTGGHKVSFTHLIAYAVVRGIGEVPQMNTSYAPPDGSLSNSLPNPNILQKKATTTSSANPPEAVRHKHVGLGLAVDLQKPDGSRTLLVPCLRDADTLSFSQFTGSYDNLLRKARLSKLSPDDFVGVTVTLTNPGTFGTLHSIPRLMAGQGLIIGVGRIGYPPEYAATDPQVLADIGVGKVVTITSTYDHRVIQGSESGIFLGVVEQFLKGDNGFYNKIFEDMGIPFDPAIWEQDIDHTYGGSSYDDDRLQYKPFQQRSSKQLQVQRLINMYRVRGHLIADLDPLSASPPPMHPELDLATYGLTIWDLDRTFSLEGLGGRETSDTKDVMTLGGILETLKNAYCKTIGVEYMHIQYPEQKQWIYRNIELFGTTPSSNLTPTEQRYLLERLGAAEIFEQFLHTRYVGQKRFGLEGAESAIVLLDALLNVASEANLSEAVIGMAHRGRLNVLANIIGKSYEEIFKEFEGDLDPESVHGSGDVKYHKGAQGVFRGLGGVDIQVTLAPNPSHLEAVDPVVEGMCKALNDTRYSGTSGVLPILIHGDAAFAGQGVVAETFNLSQLRGYHTGGTVHLIINNQLGFTTAPQAARSSVYPTDIAKMVQAPIFHVNGDDPEACVKVARLAFAFRAEFHKDVVIDMVCYRRHGHNEGDDPSYTQPLMYKLIDVKRSVRKLYTETLIRRLEMDMEEAEGFLKRFSQQLSDVLAKVRSLGDDVSGNKLVVDTSAPTNEAAMDGEVGDTGVDKTVLGTIAGVVHTPPDGFRLHPKLVNQFSAKVSRFENGEVDWATAEALAFGSLLLEGHDVRLAGQDTRRGTFSHRHAVLVDYTNGEEYIPLCHLSDNTLTGDVGHFYVYDSLLSEYAGLGFEYGYSLEAKDTLVAWEAQFGDFANGAQVIIDNFIVAAEDRWGQCSGLVLLLPHGYEGQGPEHSSARIERFLTLCASSNIRVAYPTTAAQYFHLLRSQVYLKKPKPLIIFTPKSLLRAKSTYSSIDQFVQGSFQKVLDDPTAFDPEGSEQLYSTAERILLTTGKVAHDALSYREELADTSKSDKSDNLISADVGGKSPTIPVAVVRVEQLYPWPETEIEAIINRYKKASEVVWLQEEPENMGAWPFAHGRLHRMIVAQGRKLLHVSRPESPSQATGSAKLHQEQFNKLMKEAFSKFY
ncbi:MAG: multifunctional oxoglutarate decarboxylase/oxoglutarate dehydrogenase thiamine pyrophosphate-binding subunit/dihydrolipoyllysine-residue succinyltransferase subunit [Actinobacteria bacterium]|nr:multifunctional oxoglutarate decarboxylase/oxoglutarate dehydrogenase thiamine pyrophosphate-binding subunit/dihydrolipoyllysine-residue succinyltransferase subunit [Actinomycetota bacterium]